MSSRRRHTVTGMPGPTELGVLLVSAARNFTRYGTLRLGAHNLSPARVQLITTVGESPGIRVGTLAQHLGVTNRAVTGLVDTLQAEGLIQRQPDPDDRRAFRLALTRSGIDLLTRIDRLQGAVSEDAFADFTVEERTQFAECLQRVIRRTRDLRAAADPESRN